MRFRTGATRAGYSTSSAGAPLSPRRPTARAWTWPQSSTRPTTCAGPPPRWQPESFEKNLEAAQQFTELAESKDAILSQLAFAWVLAQGDDIVAIPGTRSPDRVAENTAAAELELSGDDLARIDEILPNGGCGARCVESMLPTWH